MLNMSITEADVVERKLEDAMPILQAFGPSATPQPLPPPAASRSAAARRWGVLPAPSLEWSPQVERETAHLYQRIKAVCR